MLCHIVSVFFVLCRICFWSCVCLCCDAACDLLSAAPQDQRNLTTHLQGELDILRREMVRLKEKCDSRGRKIIHLREQAKSALPHVHVVPPTPPQPKASAT